MVASVPDVEVPDEPPLPAGVPPERIQGRNPWHLAWLRLRRNKVALACGVLFILIVLFCLAAPLWAQYVAQTGPNDNHITDTVSINGVDADVVAPDGTPLGPGLHGRYLLGADQNGRDVMVRLMYGGRTSIYIGLAAAAVTTVLAVIVALLAGYYRGWIDAVLSRVLDVIWAFPVLLLGIALGTTLAIGGLKLGIVQIAGDSIWIPILIIGLVYVPYMARPLRGEILALREEEVDVSLLCDWIVAELQDADPARDAVVAVPAGLQARGDEHWLKVMLHKLLENAWKFSAGRERVEITVQGQVVGDRLHLSIHDRGSGFDMRYADKLFVPFQRLHGPEQGGGNGLGLAIALQVAERHGGRLRGTSRPGGGSTFFIDLPAATGRDPDEHHDA